VYCDVGGGVLERAQGSGISRNISSIKYM